MAERGPLALKTRIRSYLGLYEVEKGKGTRAEIPPKAKATRDEDETFQRKQAHFFSVNPGKLTCF